MIRRFLAAALALLLVWPDAALSTEGAEPGDPERDSFSGRPLLWGVFSILNGTLLVSSIADMRYYEDRAAEMEEGGGDGAAYRDASGREKVIIGLSTISLLFSLVALKRSLGRPKPVMTFPSLGQSDSADSVSPGAGVEVISHEGRIRYDTLFTAQKDLPGSGDKKRDVDLLSFKTDTKVETVFTAPRTGAPSAPAEEGTVPPERAAGDLIGDIIRTLPEDGKVTRPGGAETFSLLPFAVHVTSYKSLASAEEDEALWSERGQKVTIEEKDLGEPGVWFRVLIGNYATYPEAARVAKGIITKYGIDYAQPVRRSGF